MKTYRTQIATLLICLIYAGQTTSILAKSDLPEELNEKFVLFTDRNLYAVNEAIWFKAFNTSHFLVKEKNWSKVMYIELVNNEGVNVFSGKYELTEHGAEGGLIIPSDLPTDNYFLLAYTRWMRNFSPLEFAFVKLRIINPKIPHNYKEYAHDSVTADHSATEIRWNEVNCSIPESTYSTREEVCLTLKFAESGYRPSNTWCVSVVKKDACDTLDFGIISSGISISDTSIMNHFIPEINGLTISGTVVNVSDSLPYPGTDVRLSVLGDRFDYMTGKTDPDGRFIFTQQPDCNRKDMYISWGNARQASSEILMDDDYASESFSFPGHPFTLPEAETRIAEEIMFAMQVQKSYNLLKMRSLCGDTIRSDFYGMPSRIIYIDDYIELPNLEEVLFELVPEVLVTEKKGEIRLQVKGRIEDHPEFALYKPLVLVDRIPVNDFGQLLKISPTRISKIELINEVYVKGDSKYGGIISIHTRKGDLAGIRLPENSMFFRFDGFTPPMHSGTYPSVPISIHTPDYRNTLYWNPDLRINPGAGTQVKFRTSDITGDYVVLIRGVSEDGKVIAGRVEFRVE